MASLYEELTAAMKSSASLSSLNNTPIKNVPNSQFKRSLFSSLRVKKKTERPSFGGLYENRLSESQASSIGSFTTDDINWPSFQPNYVKMMNDTNLLDSCAEAKQEIESVHQHVSARRLEFFETSKLNNKKMVVDSEQLLKWIAYMQKYLETFSPTWIEVKKMTAVEKNIRLNELCDLRQYIASHNRIINEMIREQDSQETRNVENMYQILLLNAIEKQCLLEGYPEVEDDMKLKFYENDDNVKLDVCKLCSIDIEPQNSSDQLLDYTITQSTESLKTKLKATIVTSDDGILFPTRPPTSKSTLFSEDHNSPFSSHSDFCHEIESLDDLIKELDNIDLNIESASNAIQNTRKTSGSSIRKSTLKLIQDVDLVLPKAVTVDEYSSVNKKVDNWLLQQPQQATESTENHVIELKPEDNPKGIMDQKLEMELDRISVESTFSIEQQWDNFNVNYTLTVPHCPAALDDFLYFGDDYSDVLKSNCDSTSTISEVAKSFPTPTSPSKSDKSAQSADKHVYVPSEASVSISRKRKRVSKKTIKQSSISYETSEMARDILLITEGLRNNYMNLKPKDFDGILKICLENLGCLIVVLDKEQVSHRSNESIASVMGDDKIYIQENCRCGIIGRFIGRIINFLYDCPRRIRKTVIYIFLMKMLKGLYAMIKFVIQTPLAMIKFVSQRTFAYRMYYNSLR